MDIHFWLKNENESYLITYITFAFLQVVLDRVRSITFKMYFNYKIQITFLKSNSNTFFNYFGYDGQNTKYKIHFLKLIKYKITRYQ